MRGACAGFGFPPTVTVSQLASSLKGVRSPQAAPGVPRASPGLLPGKAAVIRVLLRGLGRRDAHLRPAQYTEQQDRPG
jgi:hypothetical protein